MSTPDPTPCPVTHDPDAPGSDQHDPQPVYKIVEWKCAKCGAVVPEPPPKKPADATE